jgi:dipeptidyl aminopeptidase/acylaminoacyl peptidase
MTGADRLRHAPLLLIATLALAAPASAVAAGRACLTGLYRMPGGRILDIALSSGDDLRWRTLDGATGALRPGPGESWTGFAGWTDHPDGKMLSAHGCDRSALVFAGRRLRPVPLVVRDTRFRSGDATLAGRLVLPAGRGRVPVVVLVHGAEHDSALDFNSLQRILPAEGVGAFVYDKRGTGASTGTYTQDFSRLADDAIAAMREARRLAGRRLGRIGYQGGSQGGWVVPIAASRARVDFAMISFGLAVSVIDEDQEEIALEMRLKGYGPAVASRATVRP